MAPSLEPRVVSSSRRAGSDGAAIDELTRSRYSMRSVCGSARASLKRAASWMAFGRYPRLSSAAFAEARSVSPVMYVFLIHDAVDAFTPSSLSSSFTLAANAFAPAASAACGAAGCGGDGCAVEQARTSSGARAIFMAAQSTRPSFPRLRRTPLGARQLGLGVADLRHLVARLVGVGGDPHRSPAQPPAQLAVDVLQHQHVGLHVVLVQLVQVGVGQLEQPRLALDHHRERPGLHLDQCGLAEEVAGPEVHQPDRAARAAGL